MSGATSSRIVWSFENVTHRVGAAPGISRADMVTQFGEAEASRLVHVIQLLTDQTIAIEREIDWFTHDLTAGQQFMERRLQEENPGLSAGAAKWIARWFSYQVK